MKRTPYYTYRLGKCLHVALEMPLGHLLVCNVCTGPSLLTLALNTAPFESELDVYAVMHVFAVDVRVPAVGRPF